jgi:hypothetical protein
LIIPWKRTFATHLRIAHFSENLPNVTLIWSNAEVRGKEGFKSGGDVLIGLDEHFEVELGTWRRGVDGFWGKEGLDSHSLGGTRKDSVEVWFNKV